MKKIKLLLIALIVVSGNLIIAQTAPQLSLPLTISDGDNSTSLYFGIDPSATDGLDVDLGEAELPPWPMGFAARFKLSSLIGSKKDYRQGSITVPAGLKSHNIDLRWGEGSQITFSWDLPEGVTGILKDFASGGLIFTEEMIGQGSAVLTNKGITSITMDITYALEVILAPTNLVANANEKGGVNLSWTDNSTNDTGFKIEREDPSTRAFSEIATVDSNTTSYSDNSCNDGTEYKYRVRAYRSDKYSEYSNEASVTTVMNAPSGLSAIVNANYKIELNWTDNSLVELGYKIEREDPATRAFTEIGTVGENSESYIDDDNLQGATEYKYRVIAYNAVTQSEYSNIATATPPVPAPSLLTASVTIIGQIDLSWTDNSTVEEGFIIERENSVTREYSEIGTVSADVTTYSDLTVAEGKSYKYRVIAFKSTTKSEASNEITAISLLSAPSNLTSVLNQTGKVELSWTDNSTNDTGFKIEREDPSTRAFSEIVTVDSNTTSYVDNSCNEGTEYKYRVRSYNQNTNSGYSNESSITTAMNAPTGLSAVVNADNKIELNWTDNSLVELGYKIEREDPATRAFTEIGTVGENIEIYVDDDENLQGAAEYKYRVKAYNSATESEYSNTATATPPVPAPSSLTAGATTIGQIDLTWTDNSTVEDGFIIEREDPATRAYTELGTVGANVTTYSDQTVAEGTSYNYRVKAYKATTKSEASNAVSAISLITGPTNLIASANASGGVDLSWTDNTNVEQGYKIEREDPSTRSFSEIATVNSDVTNYLDESGAEGTEYKYRVQAYNTNINSAYSNESSAITVMNAPSELSAVVNSDDAIELNWTDNSSVEQGYKIEREDPATRAFTEIGTVGANVSTYVDDSDLIEAAEYKYRVIAYNATTESEYSNIATATPPVPAPSLLTASVTIIGQIDLSWTDNSTVEEGFIIEREDPVTRSYSELGTVGANIKTYTDQTVAEGTSYNYRVKAYKATTKSEASNEVTAISLITAPTNLVATANASGGVDLSWTDNTNVETDVVIERKLYSASNFNIIKTVGVNEVAFIDTNVLDGTTYSYRIKSKNELISSKYSNEDSATTILASPSELIAEAKDNGNISLQWDDNSQSELGYRIERLDIVARANGFTEIGTVGENTNTYIDTTTEEGETYKYRVKTFNTSLESLFSNVVEESAKLAQPTALLAEATEVDTIKLTWNDNSNIETGYIIEREDPATRAYNLIANLSADSEVYIDTTIGEGITYNYRVKAFNTNLTSAYSNISNVLSQSTFVEAPSNLETSLAGSKSVLIEWNDNSNNEDSFIIERKDEGRVSFDVIETVPANVTSYTDNSVEPKLKFEYRVKAHNARIESEYSKIVSITIPALKLNAPSDLVVSENIPGKITLEWKDNSETEGGFIIYRKAESEVEFVEVGSTKMNVTVFEDSEIQESVTYSYKVNSFYNSDVSDYTNTVSVKSKIKNILAPSNLAGVASPLKEIHLSWDDNSDNEIGFKLEREDPVTRAFVEIATIDSGLTEYVDKDVVNESYYKYRILAFNNITKSEYSNIAEVQAKLDSIKTPNSLTATEKNRLVTLGWNDNSTNEDGFIIERMEDNVNFTEIAQVDSNVTSFIDSSVNENMKYTYRVKGYNKVTASLYSETVEIEIKVAEPEVKVEPQITGGVKLNLNSRSNLATGFNVYRGTQSGNSTQSKTMRADDAFELIASLPADAKEFVDESAEEGKTYSYKIGTVTPTKEIISEIVSTVQVVPIAAPSIDKMNLTALNITPLKWDIDVNWIDHSNREKGFKLERKTKNETIFQQIFEANANVTNYTDSELETKTEYEYRIRAFNDDVSSSYTYKSIYLNYNPLFTSSIDDIAFNEDESKTIELSKIILDKDDELKDIVLLAKVLKASVSGKTLTAANTIYSESAVRVGNDDLIISINNENKEIEFSSTADSSGSFTVEITAMDTDSATVKDTINVLINSVNDAPILVTEIPDFEFLEDAFDSILIANFSSYFIDKETKNLTYSIVNTKNATSISIVDGKLIYKSLNNLFGKDTITVIASDGSKSVSDSFIISVSAVNDAPIISTLTDITIDEDATKEINLAASVSDVDGDKLIIEATGTNHVTNVSLIDSNLKIETKENANGKDTITVIVSDGILTTTESFIVTVSEINDAPVVKLIPTLKFDEDGSLIYLYSQIFEYVEDVDTPDSLMSIVVTSDSLNVTHTMTDSAIVLKADENWFGTDTLVIKIIDGVNEVSSQLIVNVKSVNDLPYFVDLPDSIIFDDTETYSFLLWDLVDDIESDDSEILYSLTCSTDSLLAEYDSETGNLTITPTNGFSGIASLLIEITDADGGKVSTDLVVKVNKVIVSVADLDGIPTEFELFQNYPNPFNPTTTIKYGLPKQSSVKIKIYNTLGQLVSTLFDGVQNAGYQQFNWNAARVSSGLYIYVLDANALDGSKEFREVKKMMLLK